MRLICQRSATEEMRVHLSLVIILSASHLSLAVNGIILKNYFFLISTLLELHGYPEGILPNLRKIKGFNFMQKDPFYSNTKIPIPIPRFVVSTVEPKREPISFALVEQFQRPARAQQDIQDNLYKRILKRNNSPNYRHKYIKIN